MDLRENVFENDRGYIARSRELQSLKVSKILVKLNAIALPKSTLEYIIAHEIAHIFVKRRTKRFWRTLKLICPKFEKYQESLRKYEKYIINP